MSKTIRQLWRDEYCQMDLCILCSNTGMVPVTLRTLGGYTFGKKAPCICPNGRALKTGIAARPAPAKEQP